jgi:hypothetical protein
MDLGLSGGFRFALLICALLLAGCKNGAVRVQQTVEEAPQLPPSVGMGDPKSAAQLVSGFHAIEDNAWRWTQKQFSVKLGRPLGAARTGGVLSLSLSVPPVVIEKSGPVTLTASIDGTDLAPQTYSKPGADTYKRDVPANLLAGDPVRVDFRLDKVMPPAGGDVRELGIVVLSAGLEAK